ncbi:universal stress protein [Mucilaginibacter glaciei]|uniref:Universal stress protein n=1 Tax=Mucilaginibacter glaciei TaxID=2772109 RepID=A0A926NWC7_9SPHI|nr:universal stress protein [Mucilaginibacter glaciei]MBD1393028.1 universal stress protein [Mucilaginibacter glaciei]
MKKFLVPTDFSATAKHAAEYGYQLAKSLKADIILCNAITVPAESPQAGLVVWPMEEMGLLIDDSEKKLKRLKTSMQQHDLADDFKPAISFIDKSGTVIDVVSNIIETQAIDLVIIGAHSNDWMTTFLLGDHSSQLINDSSKLLLIVPQAAKYTPIKKIAFAIDVESSEDELEELYKLIPLAKSLNAEILITHIQHEKKPTFAFEKWMDHFLTEVSNKADYDKIYQRTVISDNTEKGLKWLCEHGQVDMLAMLHRHHGFFDSLFNGSHTERMASRIAIPLLVISA